MYGKASFAEAFFNFGGMIRRVSLQIESPRSHIGTRVLLVQKLRAAFFHAIVTCCLAALSALLVFKLWYPSGLAQLTGGAGLYILILSVELCLGPLMSLVIFSPRKSTRELVKDYTIVGLVQIAAFGYGLHSTFISRPVFQVFVVDRLELISALELADEDLRSADSQFRQLPLLGPKFICVERPSDAQERSDLIFSGLKGKDIELFPKYYRNCRNSEVVEKAFGASRLLAAMSERSLYSKFAEMLPKGDYGWLPVKSRFGVWIQIYPEYNLEKAYYINFDPYMP